ncbi:MAG TPA: hypothetical protein VK074_11545 [Fodinibius sp.]|nr:hypothetical protein [Fodinibius sp.]
MNNSITIREQRYGVWKTGTLIAGGLTVIFGALFWYQTDPLWTGILRLVAFICFSLAVFGSLRLMEGPLSVSLSSTPRLLRITYRKNKKIVRKDEFEHADIQEFIRTTDGIPRWDQYLQPHSETLKVRFHDEHHDLQLFEYSGRTLFFHETALSKVQDFLQARDTSAPAPNLSPK